MKRGGEPKQLPRFLTNLFPRSHHDEDEEVLRGPARQPTEASHGAEISKVGGLFSCHLYLSARTGDSGGNKQRIIVMKDVEDCF